MKILRSLLTAALAVVSLSVSAQHVSYTIDVTTPKRPQTMSIQVKTNSSVTLLEPPADGNAPYRILIDNDKSAQYMLTQNGETKVAVQVDAFNPNEAAQNSAKPKVEVTKEIKVINGMNCRKVIAETDETATTMWMTEEAGVNYMDLFRIVNTNRNAPGARNIMPVINDVKGFPVDIVSKNIRTGEEVKIIIRDINRDQLDAAIFSLDGYQLKDMRKNK